MKRISVMLVFVLGVAVCTVAQEGRGVMSEAEMEEFAEVINELVLAERYEEAITLYDANKACVNPKALCRQDRGWWKETSQDLEERLALFNKNREGIDKAARYYEEGEYRKSWDAGKELILDSSVVYRESLKRLEALRDSLSDKRVIMEMLDARVGEYMAKFRAGDYGDLYVLLDIGQLEKYASAKDVSAVSEMVDSLSARVERDPEGLVMGGARLTERQIKEICESDVSKLLFTLKLDVIHYYGMLFDTEGQIMRYKHTDEYEAKKSALEEERVRALKRLYCQEEVVELGEYDGQEGCFHVLIGSNKGTNLTYFNYATAAPPKAFGKRFEKVVHEAFEVESRPDEAVVSGYKNGDRFLQHYLTVRAAREMAGKRCRMMVCFVPEGVRQYEFNGAELYYVSKTYDVFQVKVDLPYSTKCRVLIYTEEGEVVYDEVIKQ